MDADLQRALAAIADLNQRLTRAEAELRALKDGGKRGGEDVDALADAAVERVNQIAAGNRPPVDPAAATGPKSPESMLAQIRRLDDDGDATATPGSPGSGGMGGGWVGQSTAEKIETLRAAMCATLGSLNGMTVDCDGAGNVVIDLPGLPEDACA